ncbi:MAG: hypothetical protein M3Y50_16570 [Acidobacteriota bacterium]|nr:hypothetical protein [Acidobacteriota bacterium]
MTPHALTTINAPIDREITTRPELVQIEDGWRKSSEKGPDAVQRGHFREIEANSKTHDTRTCSALRSS